MYTPEQASSYENLQAKVGGGADKEELENIKQIIEKKAEIPSNKEISEIYEKGTRDEKRFTSYAIIRGVLEEGKTKVDGKDVYDLNKFPRLEESDGGMVWDDKANKPEIRVRYIQKDERTAWEKIRGKSPKMVYTGEAQVSINLHNGKTPEENTVVVSIVKAEQGSLFNFNDEKNRPLLLLTNEVKVNDAFDEKSEKYKDADYRFIRGMTKEDFYNYVGGKQTYDKYWEGRDTLVKKSRENDPDERVYKSDMKELNIRLEGERYRVLLEKTVEELSKVVDVTEEEVSKTKEENVVVKSELDNILEGYVRSLVILLDTPGLSEKKKTEIMKELEKFRQRLDKKVRGKI